MTYHFYDTNALLELRDLDSFDPVYNKLCFCNESLYELENIKTSSYKDSDVKYKARHIIKLLTQHEEKYLICISSSSTKEWIKNSNLLDTPDNRILGAAFMLKESYPDDQVLFYTNDLNLRAIAKIFKMQIVDVNTTEQIYKGYKEITGTTVEINDFMSDIHFNTNEYCIINNIDDGTIKEMRFDGEKFTALRLPPAKIIKAKNSLQRCAIDLLSNPNITIVGILGGYGSGKSFLSMQMAKYLVCDKGLHSKILGVREPHGEGREIGFLPGEFQAKTEFFFAPLMQQLDGGEFELESMKHRGILEEMIPYYMKGMTYNDTIILVDEAEDLTEKQLKLIGTRVGENSKIFFSGDYKQSLINTTDNNALVKMCNSMKGNPLFGCIMLSEDVRSETSKLFANLFH